jgi:hypothetical protein
MKEPNPTLNIKLIYSNIILTLMSQKIYPFEESGVF